VTPGSPRVDSLQRFVLWIGCAHFSARGAARLPTFRSAADGRICGSSGLQGRCPGTSPGHFSASPSGLDARTHLRLRWCAMRCDYLRGGRHTERVLHGARTLIDSAVFCFTAPLPDLPYGGLLIVRRETRRRVVHEALTTRARRRNRAIADGFVRPTLLTLTPTLPSRPDPCDPAIKPNLLSWDFQRSPLHRRWLGSPLSGSDVSARSWGRAAAPPARRSVVLHHLSSFLLLDRAGLFRPAADPGVHHVSPRRETKIPTVLFPPFEAFPPPEAFDTALVRVVSPLRSRPCG